MGQQNLGTLQIRVFFFYMRLWWVKVQEDLWILEFRIFLEERLGYKREKVRFIVVKRRKKIKIDLKKKNMNITNKQYL